MKRAYHLYPQVYAFENLVFAQRAATRGKRKRVDIAAFQYHLEDQLLTLGEELRAKTYQPGPYHHYTIREPNERLISAVMNRSYPAASAVASSAPFLRVDQPCA